MNQQINIIGNILGSSGYDVHTRNLANALSKLTDIKLTTQIQSGQETLLTDKELEAIKKPDKEEIRLIITNPLFWRTNLGKGRNWCFLVWEGDKIPRHYLDECLNPDIEYIFVPSEHTKNAIENTWKDYNSTPDSPIWFPKIKVISHGVDLNLFYPKDRPTDKFRFLVNKGWRNLEDRGGTQYAVRAFLEEFTSKDNIELIIKVNPAYGIPNIQQLLEELKPKDKNDFARIVINTDNLPYNDLVNLYNQADVFVMPTRAESFGIPGIEAMACGLPVITTSFGGQTDYCDKENGWIINGNLEEVKHELLYEGVKWLTPNITELRKVMREAYEIKDLIEIMLKHALETAKQFTWDNTAKKIMELI